LYKIIFYRTLRGDCPFLDFLNERPKKVQVKITKILDVLAGLGPNLKRPYADVLMEGIRELRIKFGSDQYRALYFFFSGKKIIVTHGIVKKSDSVPMGEIERALRYKKDYEGRRHQGE